jgi:alkanesulfonate monooxygenase SsuD/methylene tetrahydromethanopterin reductase-like flavin-dependent oxidoreductase (luciferase family)
MRFSILDIQPPIYLPPVVAIAEQAGYHRYWVSEHHHPTQSASPTLATAVAAGLSSRIRVGMGGVLLRVQMPRRIAADVALLRTFFPDRLDLGVAGADPGGGLAEAMTGGPGADDATYQARIEELIRLVTAEPLLPCAAHVDDARPELWLCGTSTASARLAGQLGMRYAFHQQLARPVDGAAIGSAYRDHFRPAADRPDDRPYYAIAAYGSLDDGVAALDHWRSRSDGPAPLFAGSAAACAEQLAALAHARAADEIFLDCVATSNDARITALQALASSLGLDCTSG